MSSFSTTRQSLWSAVSTTANALTDMVGTVGQSTKVLSSFVDKHSTNQAINSEFELERLVVEAEVMHLEEMESLAKRMEKVQSSAHVEMIDALSSNARARIAAYRAKK